MNNSRCKTKRSYRGGQPGSRSRSRSRSNRRSRSPSLSPMRGRSDIKRLHTDLANGINWLLSKSNLPDEGPNLRFNVEPVQWMTSKIRQSTFVGIKLSLRIVWGIIKFAITLIASMVASFEKVKSLLQVGKYILIVSKLVVGYLPTEQLKGQKKEGFIKVSPRDYEEQIRSYESDISKIDGEMGAIERAFGKIHKSDQASKKYEQLSKELTDLVEDMHTYTDENCSIIFAGPPITQTAMDSINVNSLVTSLLNPLNDRGAIVYKKRPKKKPTPKKKSSKKKKPTKKRKRT
jgi:hypothetical protein